MTDSYLRRTVLATLGALGVGAGTASAHHDHEKEQKQKQKHEPKKTSGCQKEPDRCSKCNDTCRERSYLHVTSRSPCQRKVFVSTTEETFSFHIGSHETHGTEFVGSLERLELEHGDLDVEIHQRTEHKSHQPCE